MRVDRGAALRRWRMRAELTQYDLGVRLGVKPQSVSGWERGLSDPRPSAVRALDDVLEADGAILALYGLSSTAPTDEITEALRQIAETLTRLEADFRSHMERDHGRSGVQSARRPAPRVDSL